MDANTVLTVVAIVLVVGVLAAAAWAFVVAPLVVPRRHARR
ncbi:MAG TPA: hypothetical protein VFJ91_03530 [Gaiellaceae bacterium]|nr:hypothetical protein [Gaiellaceae bacterium]